MAKEKSQEPRQEKRQYTSNSENKQRSRKNQGFQCKRVKVRENLTKSVKTYKKQKIKHPNHQMFWKKKFRKPQYRER